MMSSADIGKLSQLNEQYQPPVSAQFNMLITCHIFSYIHTLPISLIFIYYLQHCKNQQAVALLDDLAAFDNV